jgi:hypothetical protein
MRLRQTGRRCSLSLRLVTARARRPFDARGDLQVVELLDELAAAQMLAMA